MMGHKITAAKQAAGKQCGWQLVVGSGLATSVWREAWSFANGPHQAQRRQKKKKGKSNAEFN